MNNSPNLDFAYFCGVAFARHLSLMKALSYLTCTLVISIMMLGPLISLNKTLDPWQTFAKPISSVSLCLKLKYVSEQFNWIVLSSQQQGKHKKTDKDNYIISYNKWQSFCWVKKNRRENIVREISWSLRQQSGNRTKLLGCVENDEHTLQSSHRQKVPIEMVGGEQSDWKWTLVVWGLSEDITKMEKFSVQKKLNKQRTVKLGCCENRILQWT